MVAQAGTGERTATRWGAAAGLAFVILFLVGYQLTSGAPGGDVSAAERAAYYDDEANTVGIFVGTYLFVLAGLSFLWFAASLRSRLRRRGRDERLWSIAAGCGVLYVGMLFVMAMVQSTVAINVLFADNDPELGGEIIRTLDIVSGMLLLVAGALAAAVFIALVSRLGQRAVVFPSWLTVAGYVAAALVSVSFLFVPALALYLWVLIVSIYLLVRPEGIARANT